MIGALVEDRGHDHLEVKKGDLLGVLSGMKRVILSSDFGNEDIMVTSAPHSGKVSGLLVKDDAPGLLGTNLQDRKA
jgi:hypothetical protein